MFRLRICLKGCLREKNCFVSKDQTESSFRQAFKDVGFSSKYFEDSFYCHVQNFNNIFYNIKDLRFCLIIIFKVLIVALTNYRDISICEEVYIIHL